MNINYIWIYNCCDPKVPHFQESVQSMSFRYGIEPQMSQMVKQNWGLRNDSDSYFLIKFLLAL